jgi:uncharacterized membrane protein
MKFSTRQIVVAGLLTALTVTLGATGWGFVPLPTPAGAATIMHIPVIIAGVLEGPIVGAFVGLLFGLFTLPFLGDPRVVIPARLVIGLLSWLAFNGTKAVAQRFVKKEGRVVAPLGIAGFVAGVVGTLTNTGGTLFLATQFGITTDGVWHPYISSAAAWTIAATQGVPEMILAGFVVGFIVVALTPLLKRNKF